ncbi:SDR family mycofactocin-dependent oxidoreductase [Blastococcus colisei]|uniref:SDR family mycofactocin-dependent oxidoreductase n=1 Tax=Blastococcus colisei TaxID=1564162 RepID=A0A543PFH1_9ACTN|nr:mycofactocin-coupled SDR family oxidoreductase [Blastococcus colisei]TQN42817.1 SDR family mycofactocin-dependent oxidoreductase [Blastococcus colisei]
MELEGKVAVITGGARGQGRAHALRLARDGADIVLCDLAAQLGSVPYPMAEPADLEETIQLVERTGRRCIGVIADVRDTAAMQNLTDRAMAEFGRIDVLLANAGIMTVTENVWEISDQQWDETVGVNLTGVFKACRAVIPHMIEGGRGGSIVITSSVAGLRSYPALTDYTAAKHGVVGLMRNLAHELGRHNIRVNTIHPTGVATPMAFNQFFGDWLSTREQLGRFMTENVLPVGAIEPADVAEVVSWLVSDRARWLTGAAIPVDAGFLLK